MEIREIFLDTLANIQQVEIGQHLELGNVEKIMLQGILERAEFYNEEGEVIYIVLPRVNVCHDIENLINSESEGEVC